MVITNQPLSICLITRHLGKKQYNSDIHYWEMLTYYFVTEAFEQKVKSLITVLPFCVCVCVCVCVCALVTDKSSLAGGRCA